MEKLFVKSHLGHELETALKESSNIQIISREGNFLKVIYNNQVSDVEIIEEDFGNRRYTLLIDGVHMEYHIETEIDVKVREMGMEKATSSKIERIEAPMPGLVLDILVKAGQEVQEGDPLLILEAMKMENIIKAPAHSVVKKINVTKGASVEKKALLILME